MPHAPAVPYTVTVSFVVDGAANPTDAARIIADYLDAAATLLPRADIPAVYVDTAAPACGTAADAVARQLGHDGTRWRTDDGYTIDDLVRAFGGTIEHHPGRDRDLGRYGDVWRAIFPDGSVITASGGAWDIGFPECWCWQGNGHENCSAGEG
jgi:hypothetical protein